jgi:hypothetical protein
MFRAGVKFHRAKNRVQCAKECSFAGAAGFSFQRPGGEYGTVLKGVRVKRIFRRQGFEKAQSLFAELG